MNTKFMKAAIISLICGILGGALALVTYNMLTPKTSYTKIVPNNKNKNNAIAPTQKNSENAYKAVAPAVVSIVALKNTDNPDVYKEYSEGSGVIYKKVGDVAYVVTNNHVISGTNQQQIVLQDGTTINAKLVGADELTDLAVLKVISNKISTVAKFANSNNVVVGENVLAIGSPLGANYASSVTEGIVSATKRKVQTDNKLAYEGYVIQTDAAINPGNSGGPLIDLSGQIIGINSMKLTSSSNGESVEGMGFAIPSNTVVHIINQLVKHGKVIRPGLAVKIIDLNEVDGINAKKLLKLPDDVNKGVVLTDVIHGGPAQKAGLKANDVIVKIDGVAINSTSELREEIFRHDIGDKIKVSYYRAGKLKTTTITLNRVYE